MQSCVHLHPLPVRRRGLSPCSKAYLYVTGRFFPADEMHVVSQKDLISSLWALSAKTWRVVSGTRLRGQALLGGQSRGSDSCGGDGAGKLSPEARSSRRLPRGVPPGCAGDRGRAEPAALPLSGDAGLPRLPRPQRVRVGGEAISEVLGREQPGEQQPSRGSGARHPIWRLKIASAGPRAGLAAVGK